MHPHNSMGPILFSPWDRMKKLYMMPTGIFWDQLPIVGHFQNGRQCNSKNQVFAYNFPSMTDRDMILVPRYS